MLTGYDDLHVSRSNMTHIFIPDTAFHVVSYNSLDVTKVFHFTIWQTNKKYLKLILIEFAITFNAFSLSVFVIVLLNTLYVVPHAPAAGYSIFCTKVVLTFYINFPFFPISMK